MYTITHMYVYIDICMYIHVCVYVRISIHIYIHRERGLKVSTQEPPQVPGMYCAVALALAG